MFTHINMFTFGESTFRAEIKQEQIFKFSTRRYDFIVPQNNKINKHFKGTLTQI